MNGWGDVDAVGFTGAGMTMTLDAGSYGATTTLVLSEALPLDGGYNIKINDPDFPR